MTLKSQLSYGSGMDGQKGEKKARAAPPYGQGGPRTTLTWKKKFMHNNLKFYIYLPLKKIWEHPEIFFMPKKLNFGP